MRLFSDLMQFIITSNVRRIIEPNFLFIAIHSKNIDRIGVKLIFFFLLISLYVVKNYRISAKYNYLSTRLASDYIHTVNERKAQQWPLRPEHRSPDRCLRTDRRLASIRSVALISKHSFSWDQLVSHVLLIVYYNWVVFCGLSSVEQVIRGAHLRHRWPLIASPDPPLIYISGDDLRPKITLSESQSECWHSLINKLAINTWNTYNCFLFYCWSWNRESG